MLISGLLGRQPTGEVSHKLRSSLPLLSAKPQLPFQLQSVTDLGWYQFILLGEQRHVRANDMPGIAAWLWNGIKLATSGLLVQCSTYCTTMPHDPHNKLLKTWLTLSFSKAQVSPPFAFANNGILCRVAKVNSGRSKCDCLRVEHSRGEKSILCLSFSDISQLEANRIPATWKM